MTTVRRARSRGWAGLFTGANFASRSFELAVTLGAAGAVALVLAFPQKTAPTPLATWPLGAVMAVAAIPAIALAGAFPLSVGQKMYLNLGSAVAFGLLLILPPPQGLAIAFAGMLAGQLVRRSRGYRLTLPTIVFNQAQYLATWALVVLTNARIRAEAPARWPDGAWLATVGAGVVYLVVNSWLVSTHNALRRRGAAWDLWVRFIGEAGPGYAVALAIGAGIAIVAGRSPALVLPIIAAVAVAHWAAARPSRGYLRQIAPFLAALVEAAERRSFETVEHSERVSWWAERLARRFGVPESEADAIAVAAKLHDLGKIALGVPIGEDGGDGADSTQAHPAIAGELLGRVPGLEGAVRYLRAQAEWYDGSGSPDHLAGETIPLASRIIAVADAYDLALEHGPGALADGHEQALARIRGRAGTQFDPGVVAAMEALVRTDVSRESSMGTPGYVGGLLLAAAGARDGLMAATAGRTWIDRILRLEALHRVQPHAASQVIAPAAGGVPSSVSSMLIIDQQEKERVRIARELHDEVGGTLTWLRCTLRTLPDLPAVREAKASIDALTTQIRNISVDLRPAALDDLGLAAALVRHTQRYTSLTGIRVDLTHSGLDRRLPSQVETAAFRIIQEALTNVARHARVTEVAVRVRGGARMLSVLVEDRGTGFDPRKVRGAGSSSGLAGMRERALLLGGSFTVASSPGTGTRIEAHLPVGVSA
ncbi:MAG: HD domain-containing protein [Bacillati bacterium ANGP1]|uniref:histidine kinase n=1 Tax=Candidatus Segetimicrobium genomatis TaxID=2569760 RepID=A0A537K0E0_9BACT|nr:MAG: HD domain-containing protein [Terrabacteria group bacterium ANGP1]HTD48882.1 HD domain-containing phosphohydrolase [bacterium]